MPLKSFTLAISSAVTLFGASVSGAPPAPTPIPNGYVRLWNMLPATSGTFNLGRLEKPAEPLIANATAFTYSSYQGFPLGHYRLAIFRTGNQQTPLKTFDLDLRANQFFTVLISPQGIELVNDTSNPKATSGSLMVRNYFPGTPVSITMGNQPAVLLAYGQSLPLTGQFVGKLMLDAKLPNGKQAQAQIEVDLKTTQRTTLLIIPDPYGRFRPRVSADGINP
ncbi:MAG: hypothetical protein ACR2HH_02880 [Chthoniobacterales bacterium]